MKSARRKARDNIRSRAHRDRNIATMTTQVAVLSSIMCSSGSQPIYQWLNFVIRDELLYDVLLSIYEPGEFDLTSYCEHVLDLEFSDFTYLYYYYCYTKSQTQSIHNILLRSVLTSNSNIMEKDMSPVYFGIDDFHPSSPVNDDVVLLSSDVSLNYAVDKKKNIIAPSFMFIDVHDGGILNFVSEDHQIISSIETLAFIPSLSYYQSRAPYDKRSGLDYRQMVLRLSKHRHTFINSIDVNKEYGFFDPV